MPMTVDEHEVILNSLNNAELTAVERTEMLGKLRSDYGVVVTDYETQVKSIDKLTQDKNDLLHANSNLFRQVGITGVSDEEKKKEEEKSLSETITLEQLEKGL